MPTQEDISEYDIIQRYISNNCRRTILNSYLDGLEKEGYKEEEIYCDFCFPEDGKLILRVRIYIKLLLINFRS